MEEMEAPQCSQRLGSNSSETVELKEQHEAHGFS